MRVSLVMVTVVADSEGWVGTAYVYSIKLAITPLPNMQIVVTSLEHFLINTALPFYTRRRFFKWVML
ncbi:MAG: hypothetical protein AT718_03465 [Vulcanisaeta sp. JCHS_4]|jgi:hypothetical protein|nr:MAG: hypothetical protein AT718_03465 [Vulcanisaeta sp. JCHS_4]